MDVGCGGWQVPASVVLKELKLESACEFVV